MKPEIKYNSIKFVDTNCATLDIPASGEIIVVGNKENAKWAFFLCPCGCGNVLSADLMKSHSSHWDTEFDENGAISLSPSIRVIGKCNSHFFMKHSAVIWC